VIEAPSVRIRSATEADLPILEWDGQYRRLYRRAIHEARKGRRLLLVAEVGGQIAGQIFVQFSSRHEGLEAGVFSGYLYAFRVRPQFRNQGIGTRLIHEAEAALRQRGFRRAVITVAKHNHDARRLYERLGYGLFAEDPGVWSYVDHKGRVRRVVEPACVLEKWL
jgi:ribosomal protein S18 acetylase RimI-like enzyme